MALYSRFKYIIDFILSLSALIILSPVLLMVSLMIMYKLGGPVLFCQQRLGLDSKVFRIYKFRTMTSSCEMNEELLPDHLRLSKFGEWLRATSLDELPELWNVIRGDMSLVGPRPLLVEYLSLYNNEQLRRHEVLPGITGWAQVNGRNAISWEEKFKLDVWYVDNRSLWLDIKILFLTVIKIISREGINAKENVTMEKFKGNNI